jgi:hypothetical protein
MTKNNIQKLPTPEEFRDEMYDNFYNPNEHHTPMYDHEPADKMMCDLLRKFGYGEAIDIYEEAEKWYD